MSTPTVFDVADAVKDALNAETFSEAFTAVVKVPQFVDLSKLEALEVTVMPIDGDTEIATRVSEDMDVTIRITLQEYVRESATDLTRVRVLSDLLDEIRESLRFQSLDVDGVHFSYAGTEFIPFLQGTLLGAQTFCGIIDVIYRGRV